MTCQTLPPHVALIVHTAVGLRVVDDKAVALMLRAGSDWAAVRASTMCTCFLHKHTLDGEENVDHRQYQVWCFSSILF